jgi:hypothetical protein
MSKLTGIKPGLVASIVTSYGNELFITGTLKVNIPYESTKVLIAGHLLKFTEVALTLISYLSALDISLPFTSISLPLNVFSIPLFILSLIR